MVTFMTPDYRNTFTVETCRNPSADESRIASGSGVLAAELGKIGEHMHAVGDELKDLESEFGNPRHDLLAQLRGETTALSSVADSTTRRTIIDSRIEASAEQMNAQRQAITAKRRQNSANKNMARRMDIPTVLVGDDEQSRRALELLGDAPRQTPDGICLEKTAALPAKSLTQKDGQFIYHLKPSGNDRTEYVNYLITRLTKFRKAGESSGQHFSGVISFGSTLKFTKSQIGGDIYAPENFEAVCAHLKEKIDATILGKRNAAEGAPNYHEFAEAQETL